DWYVEATKLSMRTGDDAEKDRATTVLLDVLAESLKLLHPLLPFVTEEIYGKLPNTGGLLITAPYPEYAENRDDLQAERAFSSLQELVRMVRTLRSECTITPDKKIRVLVRLSPAYVHGTFLREQGELIKLLAGIGILEIADIDGGASPGGAAGTAAFVRPAGSIGLVGSGFEAFVYIADAVDMAALKQKFSKDLEKDRKFITGLRAKLANEQFINNAPAELVEGEKKKLEDALIRAEKTESYIRDMA
ncbi:class I tRNA ligase family protein, partial [Treponema sp. OttesenSCG-928-L16]|nr:class I tRNA ligase family protein [Treponema sp. OttesenSCG-928-L16]